MEGFKEAYKIDLYDAGVSIATFELIDRGYGWFDRFSNSKEDIHSEPKEIEKTHLLYDIDDAPNTEIKKIMAQVETSRILQIKVFNQASLIGQPEYFLEIVDISYNGRYEVWWKADTEDSDKRYG